MTRRYRAPAADGGLLADPPPEAFGELLDHNRRLFAASGVRVHGSPLAEFRRSAAAEVVGAARRYHADAGEPVPAAAGDGLLLAGHQPELFHPGVWVKNFALAALARRHGLTPLNLVVDNDTAKAAALRLPAVSADPTAVALVTVPFDRWAGEVAYEERPVADEALFAGLPAAADEVTANWGFGPFLGEFWAEVLRHRGRTPVMGERFAAARRWAERRWGCHNLELPVGRLAGTAAFARFVAHWLADHAGFRAAYNECLHDYRLAHGVRSRHHPVPDLAESDGWGEVPFWAWRAGERRRSRLFARDAGGCHELRLDAGPVAAELPKADAADALLRLGREGLKVRPRALTLTLFARLALADAFVHGIGGATYDELTDAIAARCFGGPVPRFAVLSATLRLPLPAFAAGAGDVRRLERLARDLDWNPQRHLAVGGPPWGDLAAAKAALAGRGRPERPEDRRDWFSELRSLTERLRGGVAGEARAVAESLAAARHEAAANDVLRRRDYPFVLFPSQILHTFFSNSVSHPTVV